MLIELQKKLAAGLSILSNVVIIILKLTAGLISGSISIISEAIHSFSDLLASVLTFFAVSRSSEPADDEHPYGHGKYEDISGFLEGLLIIVAAFYIIFEATKKLLFGQHIHLDSMLGIWVMGFAVVTNLIVSSYLFRVAKKSNSISLFADGQHLRTDVYSSFGVLVGLITIKITHLTILDPIIAIIVAVIIFKTGFSISKETLNNLLDGSLPREDLQFVEEVLNTSVNISGYKNLKSRKSGPTKDIEVTILLKRDMPLFICQDICDEIECRIKEKVCNTVIIIHAEPFLS